MAIFRPATVYRIFVWRGEKLTCKPANITIRRVSRGDLLRFRPKTRLYDMAQISHHSKIERFNETNL